MGSSLFAPPSFEFMNSCQIDFIIVELTSKFNLKCHFVERFGTNEKANGQGIVGVGVCK
jgi:hypothetical protein